MKRAGRVLAVALLAGTLEAQRGGTRPVFEAVSIQASAPVEQACRLGTSMIQPSRFGCRFIDMIYFWGPRPYYPARLITGLPAWAYAWRFDMRAKATAPVGVFEADRLFALAMEERFRFRWHWVERPGNVLALVPAKGGVKLAAAKPCVSVDPGVPPPVPAPGSPPVCGRFLHPGTGFEATGIRMERLASALQDLYREPISDETGYAGMFDLRLMFSNDRAGVESDEPGGLPSLEAALRSVGLRIIRKPGIEKVFVVDSLQKPTEN